MRSRGLGVSEANTIKLLSITRIAYIGAIDNFRIICPIFRISFQVVIDQKFPLYQSRIRFPTKFTNLCGLEILDKFEAFATADEVSRLHAQLYMSAIGI